VPVVSGIDLCEVLPFVWQIICGKDGGNRTRWNAGSAIDALNGINVQLRLSAKCWLILPWVNAMYRASVYASGIFGPNAGFSYDECHNWTSQFKNRSGTNATQ
jgi:hypothetical protein